MSHCTYEALPGHEKNLLRASLVWPSVSLNQRDTYSVHAILAASDSVALIRNLIVILEVCGTLRRRTWWPSVF